MAIPSNPLALAAVLAAGQYVFKIHKSRDGQFYWTFHNTAGNTEVICQSETYTTKQNAQNAIDLVKRFSASARTLDLT